MVELLRRRDGLSIAKACKAIAERGAIKGKPETLQGRHKWLMHHVHWKPIIQIFKLAKAKLGVDRYIEFLEEVVGGRM
jgi:hypothetical protein